MCTARTAQDGNKFLCTLTLKRKKQQINTLAADDSDGRKRNKFECDISTAKKKVKTFKECLKKTLTKGNKTLLLFQELNLFPKNIGSNLHLKYARERLILSLKKD